MLRCLIIDKVHDCLLDGLKEFGLLVDYHPQISIIEVFNKISDYELLIFRSKLKIDNFFIKKAKKLFLIARVGAGIEQINFDTSQRNIAIINAPEGNRDAVAEYVVAVLLLLLRKISYANNQMKQFLWDRESIKGKELKDKTIGIIGYGNMGKNVAKRLYPFGCKILAYDIKYKHTFEDNYSIVLESLDRIFEEADIISLHTSLNKENIHYFNKTIIDKFKKPFYLINTSRGPVAPLSGLYYGMNTKKISGLAIDVFENEPPFFNDTQEEMIYKKLISYPNVLFTPHIAGITEESYKKLSEVLLKKIISFLQYRGFRS